MPQRLSIGLLAGLLLAQQFEVRRITAADLLNAPAGLNDYLDRVEAETKARMSEGERDHLIFFLLQSKSFTNLTAIEPALSARKYAATSTIPDDVHRRIAALLSARGGARITYFRSTLHLTETMLEAEYRRVMAFLVQKEFSGRSNAEITELYRRRGHSTDTQVESSYTVDAALAVLAGLGAETPIGRVLIAGPGLDFAPRSNFYSDLPAQSYQPYTVLDGLLRLGLSRKDSVAIHCVDINPRVLNFIDTFPQQKPPTLYLRAGTGDADFRNWFQQLGNQIGERYGEKLTLRPAMAARVTASHLNIVTQRFTTKKFQLIIATNILLYFDSRQLRLAMANLASMLEPGGYLIHNDVRPEIDTLASSLYLQPMQARSVRIGGTGAGALFDTFALYRKRLE